MSHRKDDQSNSSKLILKRDLHLRSQESLDIVHLHIDARKSRPIGGLSSAFAKGKKLYARTFPLTTGISSTMIYQRDLLKCRSYNEYSFSSVLHTIRALDTTWLLSLRQRPRVESDSAGIYPGSSPWVDMASRMIYKAIDVDHYPFDLAKVSATITASNLLDRYYVTFH